MTVKVTDRLDWTLAFSAVSAAHAAADPPDDAQFEGGSEAATILIHIKVTTGPAKLLIQFYNSEAAAWVDGVETTITAGQRSIKLDIAGMAGGLRISEISAGTVDWCYFKILSRHAGGN